MHDDDVMDRLLKDAMAADAPQLSRDFDARVMQRVRPRRLTPMGHAVIAAYALVAAATAAWCMRDLPVEMDRRGRRDQRSGCRGGERLWAAPRRWRLARGWSLSPFPVGRHRATTGPSRRTTSASVAPSNASMMRDLRQALRIFRREPAFAAAAVATLALGIGANTALFAIVEAALLRPLPFERADDLVVLRHRDMRTGLTKPDVALGDFMDLRGRQRSLESLAGFGGFQSTFLGSGEAVRVQGAAVTPDALRALRLQPTLGRLLQDDDAREGAAPVAMVSHEFWRTDLGSDPQAIARSIQLGQTRTMVVGVLPAGFRFPGMPATDLIVPQAAAGRRAGAAEVRLDLRHRPPASGPDDRTGRRGDDSALAAVRSRVPRTEHRHAVPGAFAARVAGRRHAEAAAAVAGRRRLRPADGVRQCRQPDACASTRPAARAGRAAGAWREPSPAGGTGADGGVLPCRGRRRAGPRHRVERRASPCCAGSKRLGRAWPRDGRRQRDACCSSRSDRPSSRRSSSAASPASA